MVTEAQQILASIERLRQENNEGMDRLDGKIDRTNTKIDQANAKIDQSARDLRGEIADVRKTATNAANGVARLQGRAQGQAAAIGTPMEAFGPSGTGRFPAVAPPRPQSSHDLAAQAAAAGLTPPTGTFVVPAPPPGVSMELRVGGEKRSSVPPVLSGIVKFLKRLVKGKGGIAAIAATFAGGNVAHYVVSHLWSQPAVASVDGAASIRTPPAPPPVVSLAPLEPTAPPASTTNLPDGAVPKRH